MNRFLYNGLLSESAVHAVLDFANRGYRYAVEVSALPDGFRDLLKVRTYAVDGDLGTEQREGPLYGTLWREHGNLAAGYFVFLKDEDDRDAFLKAADSEGLVINREPFQTVIG